MSDISSMMPDLLLLSLKSSSEKDGWPSGVNASKMISSMLPNG